MGVIDLPLENSKFSSGINIPRGYTESQRGRFISPQGSITTGNIDLPLENILVEKNLELTLQINGEIFSRLSSF